MSFTSKALSVKEIGERVSEVVGPTKESSVRSYLRLNTPRLFIREERGVYKLQSSVPLGIQRGLPLAGESKAPVSFGRARLYHADCFDWLGQQEDRSIHAVVTDPPYGIHEYTREQQAKLRRGKGGVWRIPPSFDGHLRSPVPRFTTLTQGQLTFIGTFFFVWTRLLLPKLVPGAHVVVACNPLVVLPGVSGIGGSGAGAAWRNRKVNHDHEGWRPSQSRSRRVFRCQCNAALEVGNLSVSTTNSIPPTCTTQCSVAYSHSMCCCQRSWTHPGTNHIGRRKQCRHHKGFACLRFV